MGGRGKRWMQGQRSDTLDSFSSVCLFILFKWGQILNAGSKRGPSVCFGRGGRRKQIKEGNSGTVCECVSSSEQLPLYSIDTSSLNKSWLLLYESLSDSWPSAGNNSGGLMITLVLKPMNNLSFVLCRSEHTVSFKAHWLSGLQL